MLYVKSEKTELEQSPGKERALSAPGAGPRPLELERGEGRVRERVAGMQRRQEHKEPSWATWYSQQQQVGLASGWRREPPDGQETPKG